MDRSKAEAYGPGRFIENPAGSKHFEWFGSEVVAHIEGLGSRGAMWSGVRRVTCLAESEGSCADPPCT